MFRVTSPFSRIGRTHGASLLILLLLILPALPAFAGEKGSKEMVAIRTEVKKTEKAAELAVTLHPKKGYEIKPDTPLELKLPQEAASLFAKTAYGWPDVADAKARVKRIRLPFDPKKRPKGGAAWTAKIRFVLCSAKSCHLIRESVPLSVK